MQYLKFVSQKFLFEKIIENQKQTNMISNILSKIIMYKLFKKTQYVF